MKEKLTILSIFRHAVSQNKVLSIILLISALVYVIIDKFVVQTFIISIVQNVRNFSVVSSLIIHLGMVFAISFCSQAFLDYKTTRFTDSLTNSLIQQMARSVYHKYENNMSNMETELITTYFEKMNSSLMDLILIQKWRKLSILLLPACIIMYAFYVNTKLGVLMLVSLVAIYYLSKILITYVQKEGQENEKNKNKILNSFSDFIQNILSIYSNGTIDRESEILERNNQTTQFLSSAFARKFTNIKILFILLTIVLLLSIIYVIIYKFSNISTNQKQNLIILIISIIFEMYQLISISNPMQEQVNSFNAIADIFKADDANQNTTTTLPKNLQQIQNYDIKCNNLCFQDILKNITIQFPFGQRCAIMGHIGSGKSTFIKLLTKYAKPCKGNIYLGNNNIDHLNLIQYRSIIAYIPQHVSLFNRSIESNLFYGSIITPAQKEAIIELYNIRSFFGNDLKRRVGHNGKYLSGGQRQMLYILRNIIQPFRQIFIMDEPTVGLDQQSFQYLLMLLNRIQNKTLLIITHDHEVLKIMDRVIYFEKGQIKKDRPL